MKHHRKTPTQSHAEPSENIAPRRLSRRKRSLAVAVAAATGVVLPTGAHSGVAHGAPSEPLAERIAAPGRVKVRAPADWSKVEKAAQSAVANAIAVWRPAATLSGVVVNAVTAAGGTLVGPPLQPLIVASMVNAGVPSDVATAYASVVSTAWAAWAASVRVPGLPWYPAFAAFPGPVAPPTPNTPTPLMAMTMTDKPLSPSVLGAALRTALGTRMNESGSGGAVDRFTQDLWVRFNTFVASCIVSNVLGTGPVPTFAPPYVPCGPVVGGTANMAAGGLTGAWPQF
jgi:hypothetical protein